jgi:hypothetical protein
MSTIKISPRQRAAAGTSALEVELLLSTPSSIVVRARVEFDDGRAGQEAGLVIPRHCCRGNRPSLAALQKAAQLCAVRLSRSSSQAPRAVRRLLACINGRWFELLQPTPA